jgi:metal-responsive CopG/Arc/MetJ family transcriptional regulator
MPRPKLPPNKQRTLIGVRLPIVTWETLDDVASQQNRPSRNNLIEHIINEYFKANNITPNLISDKNQAPKIHDNSTETFPTISTQDSSTILNKTHTTGSQAKISKVETPFD